MRMGCLRMGVGGICMAREVGEGEGEEGRAVGMVGAMGVDMAVVGRIILLGANYFLCEG